MTYSSYRRSTADVPYAQLSVVPGGLAFISSYDADLVADLKAQIPHDGRRWDATHKHWIIAPAYAAICVRLAEQYFGIQLTVPAGMTTPTAQIRLIRLEYLGRCKDRGDGSAAYGWADGGWTTRWPELVLREWFGAAEMDRPDTQPTLYAVLGVKTDVEPDGIKVAYRRLVKQWHPDVCKEADAIEVFKRIQMAYETLADPIQRRKYDAGRYFEAQIEREKLTGRGARLATTTAAAYGYRAPLRCGDALVEGFEDVRQFTVGKILQFADITDSAGRVMTTSWSAGAKQFEVRWV